MVYRPAMNSIKGAFSSTKRYKIEIRVKKEKRLFDYFKSTCICTDKESSLNTQ